MEENVRNDIDSLIGEHYVPSELERKKSLMMYVIWGILLSLSQERASRYEQFHLKQALGWRTMFFLMIIPSIVLAFIPYIRVIPLLAYAILLAVWVIFFIQAWHGGYTSFSKEQPFLPVFAGFGEWVLGIFDSRLKSDSQTVVETQNVQQTTQQPQPQATPTQEMPSQQSEQNNTETHNG